MGLSAYSTQPFANGSHALPEDALTLNGSTLSSTATSGPSVACATGSTCTLADDSQSTYPVAIPDSATGGSIIYSASANSGLGAQELPDPQWWLAVPGNAQAGTYQAEVVLSVASGPTPTV